jgi:hypothetical protein
MASTFFVIQKQKNAWDDTGKHQRLTCKDHSPDGFLPSHESGCVFRRDGFFSVRFTAGNVNVLEVNCESLLHQT